VFGTFDRYLLRGFIFPYVYALIATVAIWLVYDIGVNLGTFQDNHFSLATIGYYYWVQIPYVLVNFMPLAVLLGLLYVLTRMSRRNEIVSMLSAGMGVTRILMPLIVTGALLTGVCGILNFELAPLGLYAQSYLIDELAKGHSKVTILNGQVFASTEANRIWYIQRLNTKTEQMNGVMVIQRDTQGIIESMLYAQTARHNKVTKAWTFAQGKIAWVDQRGTVTHEEYFDQKLINGWSETPWQLGSTSLKGRLMTVPQLQRFLRVNAAFPKSRLAEYRTQFWYRFALPWSPLIVVIVASPMCVVFQRRGALGGIAGGLFLFIGLYISGNVFNALGQGDRIPPILAGWAPVILFMSFGIWLFYLRATNRPLPFLG
jgi:lipopolysaccharide export system permease protein